MHSDQTNTSYSLHFHVSSRFLLLFLTSITHLRFSISAPTVPMKWHTQWNDYNFRLHFKKQQAQNTIKWGNKTIQHTYLGSLKGLPAQHSSQDPVSPPRLLRPNSWDLRDGGGVSTHLRRWLRLPKSLSSIALYVNSNTLQLPIESLEEEFKVTRAREQVVQYKDSSDPNVAKAGIQVRSGRTWREEEAVQDADARLRHRSVVGVVTQGRAVLGSFPTPQMNTRGKKERRWSQIAWKQ